MYYVEYDKLVVFLKDLVGTESDKIPEEQRLNLHQMMDQIDNYEGRSKITIVTAEGKINIRKVQVRE